MPEDKNTSGAFEQVPVELLKDTGLTDSEVVYYVLIIRLSHKEGYCYMSSRELGKLRGKGMRTAQRVVESLKKKGYIKAVVYTDERGKSHRKIFPVRYVKSGVGVKNDIGSYDKSDVGGTSNLSPTYVKSGTQIILKNNTKVNKSANADLRKSTPSQKGKRKKFVPPSLDEVGQYVAEKNLAIDPRRFFDFYTAGEWHDSSGKPVKNWKQKALTWDRREQKERKSKPPVSPSSAWGGIPVVGSASDETEEERRARVAAAIQEQQSNARADS